jgi:hypothetical protein
MHLNGSALNYLKEKNRAGNTVGKSFRDVFPEFANLATQIESVVEQRLDKIVSGGHPSYVILSEKNFRQEIERIILILRKIGDVDLPERSAFPKD